jgi:hypothetical protein
LQLSLGVRRLYQSRVTQTMRAQSVSERRATRLYSRAAWAVLALILLGYAMYLPVVHSALAHAEDSAFGRFVWGVFLLGAGLAMLALWGAAIWYACASDEVIFGRPILVAVLVLTNGVGAFFYYWCAVHWRSGTRIALRTPASAERSARAV